MAEEEPKPIWQRRADESAKAYSFARAYFELGPERTVRKAFESLGKAWVKPGGGKTGIRWTADEWSSKYEWVARAKSFDDYIERERQKTFEKAAAAAAQMWLDRELAARQKKFEQGQALVAKVDKMLEFPLASVTTEGRVLPDGRVQNTTVVRPARWSMDTAARMSVLGHRIVGEAIHNKDGSDTAGDLVQEEFLFEDAK